MVEHKRLGFETLEEYNNYFFETLMITNHTYDFFVNWEKVKSNVNKYVTEINILDSLTKIDKSRREAKFDEILHKYPETLQVIPIIIAVRKKKFTVFDIDKNDFVDFNFNTRKYNIENMKNFCEKSGILQLFDEINDLYDYLLGVEVGLDTNARKNRSGTAFENLVKILLEKKIEKNHNLSLVEQDSNLNLERDKIVDFVIYDGDTPIMGIETNFYNTRGSKPSETANAYIKLNKEMKDNNIKFVWVTDGKGWEQMKNPLINASKEIDFVTNYKILDEKFGRIFNSV